MEKLTRMPINKGISYGLMDHCTIDAFFLLDSKAYNQLTAKHKRVLDAFGVAFMRTEQPSPNIFNMKYISNHQGTWKH